MAVKQGETYQHKICWVFHGGACQPGTVGGFANWVVRTQASLVSWLAVGRGSDGWGMPGLDAKARMDQLPARYPDRQGCQGWQELEPRRADQSAAVLDLSSVQKRHSLSKLQGRDPIWKKSDHPCVLTLTTTATIHPPRALQFRSRRRRRRHPHPTRCPARPPVPRRDRPAFSLSLSLSRHGRLLVLHL